MFFKYIFFFKGEGLILACYRQLWKIESTGLSVLSVPFAPLVRTKELCHLQFLDSSSQE